MTATDYRELPEGPPFSQLIEGDLIVSPSPDRFHQHILINLAVVIRTYLEKNPVGKLVIAPSDVRLTETDVYQPDLYFVSNERRSILTRQGTDGAPDLVVEILSTASARYDRGLKREIYARTGVTELWIVDPEARQFQIYHLAETPDEPTMTCAEGQPFSSRLFPGLVIDTARVFRDYE